METTYQSSGYRLDRRGYEDCGVPQKETAAAEDISAAAARGVTVKPFDYGLARSCEDHE
jgi:hypothetical protein